MATSTASPTKVVTGKVRLSYVHLFEPYSNDPSKDARYSVTLLIPKSDKKTIAKIRSAQEAAKERDKGKWGGKIPSNLKQTLHDGDEEADLEQNPEYEGHMFIAISSSEAYPPGIVDENLDPILDKSEVYSGCYARVSMDAYGYNNESKGVTFGLRNVKKVADGEFLGGGRSNPEDDFGDDDDDDGESLI
jgi:hypothetical protein